MKQAAVVSYNSSSEEEVVLVHVQFSSRLHDSDTNLEAEEQLVDLKQATTCVPAEAQIHRTMIRMRIRLSNRTSL